LGASRSPAAFAQSVFSVSDRRVSKRQHHQPAGIIRPLAHISELRSARASERDICRRLIAFNFFQPAKQEISTREFALSAFKFLFRVIGKNLLAFSEISVCGCGVDFSKG
jgi:hypothetical protein